MLFAYTRAGSEQQRRNEMIMDWFSLTDKYHLQQGHYNYWYIISITLLDFSNQNYNYMIKLQLNTVDTNLMYAIY